MAKEYRVRPSALLGVSDPYIAYCLDESIFTWGNYVDNEVAQAGSKGNSDKDKNRNRQRRLSQLLPDETTKQKFRDPAQAFKKKAD